MRNAALIRGSMNSVIACAVLSAVLFERAPSGVQSIALRDSTMQVTNSTRTETSTRVRRKPLEFFLSAR